MLAFEFVASHLERRLIVECSVNSMFFVKSTYVALGAVHDPIALVILPG
jgi:hypothetical protein